MKRRKTMALVLAAGMIMSYGSGIVFADETDTEIPVEVAEETEVTEETEQTEEAGETEETEETEVTEVTMISEEPEQTETSIASEETEQTETEQTETSIAPEETDETEMTEEVAETVEIELEEDEEVLASGLYINETNFPDDNFRNYIINSVNPGRDDYMTSSEVNAVKRISCRVCHITNLKGIEYFTNLEYIDVYGNTISSGSLDVNDFSNLTYLNCSSCGLSELVVNDLDKLETIYCSSNSLRYVNLLGCTSLTKFSCGDNNMYSVDTAHATALQDLDCPRNVITGINCSNLKDLTRLYAPSNSISTLDLTSCTKLKQISLDNNNLTSIKINGLTSISSLSVGANNLTKIDLDGTNLISSTFNTGWGYAFDWSESYGQYIIAYHNGEKIRHIWCDPDVVLTSNGSRINNFYLPAPASVTATPTGVIRNVYVKWSEVEHASNYLIYRKEINDSNWTLIATVASDKTSYIDQASKTNGTFQYMVGTKFIFADGTYNNGYTKSSGNVSFIPTCPSGLTNYGYMCNGVNLKWNSVLGAQQYNIYMVNSETGYAEYVDSTTDTTYEIADLVPGTNYTFRVTTVYYYNGNLVETTAASVICPTLPVVNKVDLTRQNASNFDITVTWAKAQGAESYRVERATSQDGPWTVVYQGTATRFVDKGRQQGVRYYYIVTPLITHKGNTICGVGSLPNSILIPKDPTGLRVTATTRNTISLTWNKVPGNNIIYEVWRSRNKTSGYVCLGRYTENSKVSSSLNPNTTYYYKVRAYYYYYDSDGNIHRVYSNYTPVLSATTKK